MLLNKDEVSFGFFFSSLNDRAIMFEMRSAYSKCIGSRPNFLHAEENLGEANTFCYLRSYISPGYHVSDGVSSRKQNDRLTFTNLRHL